MSIPYYIKPDPWTGSYNVLDLRTNQHPGQNNDEKCCSFDINWNAINLQGNPNIPTASPKWGQSFDLTNVSPVKFRQIAAIYVDNMFCDKGVWIVFPDTNYTLFVEAFEPGQLYPVITADLKFDVQCDTVDYTGNRVLTPWGKTTIIACEANIPPFVKSYTKRWKRKGLNLRQALLAGGLFSVLSATIPGPSYRLRECSIYAVNGIAGSNINVQLEINGEIYWGPIDIVGFANNYSVPFFQVPDLAMDAWLVQLRLTNLSGGPSGELSLHLGYDIWFPVPNLGETLPDFAVFP